MKTLLAFSCIAFTSLSASATDAIDDELLRYHEGVIKAESTYKEALERQQKRGVSSVMSTIKRHNDDPKTLAALWQLVLDIDPENEDAIKFFTEKGTLAKVQSEIANLKNGDLIGDGTNTAALEKSNGPRVSMSGAKIVSVVSSYYTGANLGSYRAGTTIALQYHSGKWSGDNIHNDNKKNQSPDDPSSSESNRIQLYVDSGNDKKVLATVPAGTAQKPFLFTLEEDVVGLSLRIADRNGLNKGRRDRDRDPRPPGGNNGGGNGNGGGGGNGVGSFNLEPSAYSGNVKYLFRALVLPK